jgi:hypothetical protein
VVRQLCCCGRKSRSLMTQKMDENWHTLCPALGSAGPGQQICKVSARKPSIKNNESGFTNNWCFLRQRHLLNHKAQLHTDNYHLPGSCCCVTLAPRFGQPKIHRSECWALTVRHPGRVRSHRFDNISLIMF